jgi:hypothetical protein
LLATFVGRLKFGLKTYSKTDKTTPAKRETKKSAVAPMDFMIDDETDAELQRQIELWQRADEVDEAAPIETDAEFWQRIEIWQTDSGAPEELPDGEIERLLALYGEPADSSATDGEIEAEWLEKIKDWQRADEENEPVRLEAEARELDELDALLDRLEAEPDL